MPGKRPIQKDVARLAGVSTGTVSLVLNNKAGGDVPISHETKQKVLQAAEQLGYTLNPVAQMLARGRNNVIGVFTYENEFPYEQEDRHHPFLIGIEREASRQNYDILLLTNHSGKKGHHIYANGVNRLRLADGAIILGAYPDRGEVKRLIAEDYPFVFIGRREIPGYQINWVVNDYIAASYDAARHLLDLGHRHIGIPVYRPDAEATEDKLAGCQRAIDEVEDSRLHLLADNCLDDPGRLVQQLDHHNITALICHDMHLFGNVFALLESQGIHVPHDVSMVALEDGDGQISCVIPPTYVRLSKQRIGEHAVRILLDRLQEDMERPQQIRIPCDLILGETTKALSG